MVAAFHDIPLDSRDHTHADFSVPPAQHLPNNDSEDIPRTPAVAQQTTSSEPSPSTNDPSASSNDGLATPTAPDHSFADSVASTGPAAAVVGGDDIDAELGAGMSDEGTQDADGASIASRDCKLGDGRQDKKVRRWHRKKISDQCARRSIGVFAMSMVFIMIIAFVIILTLAARKRVKGASLPLPSSPPATAPGATVRFFVARNDTCDGIAAQEYRNVPCNSCVDPPGDWQGAQVIDVSDNQRITFHNTDSCTPKSQVGQRYGNTCNRAGKASICSLWVACEGQQVADNTTAIDGTEQIFDLE